MASMGDAAGQIDVDLAQRTTGSMFRDPNDWNLEKLRRLVYMDRIIPPQTTMNFMDCMYEGFLPGGGRTSFPAIYHDEVPLWNLPYSHWAPAPWNSMKYSLMDKLSGEYSKNGPAIPMPSRVQPLKARLWSGMVPMTGVRWKEKKLDDPDNYMGFFDLMLDILKIFMWFNDEQVQNAFRHGFNWLSDEYGKFETAINARRERNGISERVNITGQWAEYMEAIFTTMTNRTYNWLLQRVDEVQTKSLDEYKAAIDNAGNDVTAITAAGKVFFERVQDLNLLITRLDFTLFMPMEGYKGHTPAYGVRNLPLAVRQDVYYRIADSKSWESHEPFANDENRNVGLCDRDALLKYFRESRENRASIRKEFRGEPKKLGAEHWVTILKSRIDWYLSHGGDPERQTWGFVCYRLTYRQTPEEWIRFREKLEADLLKSGEWVEGADKVKATGGIQWLDGQELGISEGDIIAARRHFATFPMTPSFMRRMWKMDFLVVDPQSYDSYMSSMSERDESKPYGDMGGHVRLVDTAVYDPQLIKEVSPGFTGDFKVLTTLVFDELYPLLVSLTQRPLDLWPLARLHPHSTYVGQTVQSQEDEWELQRDLKANMLSSFFNYLRMQQGRED
ncbi:hypothetical protein CC78DRAFT_514899 [Lojkania enalia]|uniref:Uncharacterized protein n=1 Tax=Lojkania enalia TaxID=147567 RepID=A0A9P4N523_9PLEO|nr:hypothetical protein CC78DRAFT_514899 [Didymosphaeria enalia]